MAGYFGGGDPGHLVALVRAADLRPGRVGGGRRYVESCRAPGISRWRITVWHVLPSAITPLITHNFAVASELCEQTAVLNPGRIAESVPTAELLTAPAHPLR